MEPAFIECKVFLSNGFVAYGKSPFSVVVKKGGMVIDKFRYALHVLSAFCEVVWLLLFFRVLTMVPDPNLELA